jgi:hypothetical protein
MEKFDSGGVHRVAQLFKIRRKVMRPSLTPADASISALRCIRNFKLRLAVEFSTA